jgi:hypothetical protein
LYRIVDVEITLDEVSGSELIVTVAAHCDGTPILGLITADFLFLNEDGNEVSLTAAEEGEGVYTLTGTFVDGTLNLVPADELSIQAYAGEEVDVAIPS